MSEEENTNQNVQPEEDWKQSSDQEIYEAVKVEKHEHSPELQDVPTEAVREMFEILVVRNLAETIKMHAYGYTRDIRNTQAQLTWVAIESAALHIESLSEIMKERIRQNYPSLTEADLMQELVNRGVIETHSIQELEDAIGDKKEEEAK